MKCLRDKKAAVINRIKRFVSASGRDAELPVTDSFLLEMADDGVLRVRGCRGIAAYAPERIVLTTDRFLLTVQGEGLFLSHYSDTDAAVGGAIAGIAFGG